MEFGCNYVPGQADDRAVLTLAAEVCGAVIRRLIIEAYTLTAADLRVRVERKNDETPRKLAQAERSPRYADQVARLKGLELRGELEPFD